MKMKEYEVVVIGGSVAGSSLAIRLGKAGIRAAVIDKSEFPRRKACGEGLSDVALKNLGDLGIAKDLLSQEHRPFYGYRAWRGDFHVDIAYRKPRSCAPKGIGVQRYLLDNLLVKKIREYKSVTTFWGRKVTCVEKTANGFSIRLGKEQLTAKYLVLADGANSVFARRLGVPCKVGKSPSWGMSWMFEGQFSKPINSVLVIVKNGYEIYCTPVSDERINVCYLARKHRVSEISNQSRALTEITEELKKARFVGKPVDEPIGIGPLGCSRRPSSHQNIFLVGDALESLDPISGMGMTHGLITAELVANTLSSILRESVCPAKAKAKLEKQRKKAVRPFRGFTRLTGLLLRGTRNPNKLLELLSKTNLPEQVREVLRGNNIDSSVPGTIPAALLMVLGL